MKEYTMFNISMLNYTEHYLKETLAKRPYLIDKEAWLLQIIDNPVKKIIQENGRIKYWGYISKIEKYLRVITLEDGITVHTAFPDRNFKE